jgi:hypothetical protein
MAVKINKFSHQARSSILGQIVDSEISVNSNILNGIDFLEGDSGPKVTLYPVQRFIYKCILGVPLDYKEGTIIVKDKFAEEVLYTFTEREYLDYLYSEGRINVEDWQDLPERGFNEAVIFAGRRGGKSQLVSAIADFKLYKLLSIRSPHEHFGLVEGSPIEFTFLAQDNSGANRLYDKFKSDINSCPFFSPYLRKTPGSKSMEFVTEADKDKRDVIPSIKIGAWPCTTNAVRGPSSYFLALDEFAHFRNEKGSNSDEVYEAAAPATMNFTSTETGLLESLILTITSPWKREGKAYDLHAEAMKHGPDSGIFTLMCSSAEMNPRSNSEYLRKKAISAALTWKAEYGGQFLDSAESYVPVLSIERAIDRGRENTVRYQEEKFSKLYFWALDLGMKHDATALAIGHLEYVDGVGIQLYYDYIGRKMVGEAPYEHVTEIPLEDILNWMIGLNSVLPCYKGCTDQHGGSMLTQLLKMNDIENFELVHLNTGINSQMYYTLKGFIDQGAIRFPDVPIFEKEIKSVEATIVSKYQIRVQAPNEKGAHDDMCDVVALVAYLANQFMKDEPNKMDDIISGNNIDPLLHGLDFDPEVSSLSNYRMSERIKAMTREDVPGRPGRLAGRRF